LGWENIAKARRYFNARIDEAQKRYEEAKREAANEAHYRHEAEIKRKKIEEEIQRIAKYEAEKREVAEVQAAQQIKEQASRLEKQALQAEQKANEARLLAESEAERRGQAEAARIKAEEEARRLAEEIIEAQKQLEKAHEQAKFESEKRVLEEEARKKAEESARSSLLENQQNIESLKKILISQIEAAQQQGKSESGKRVSEESDHSFSTGQDNAENFNKNPQSQSNLVKNSSQALPKETLLEFQKVSSGRMLVNTTSSDISNTNQIPVSRNIKPVFLVTGLFAFLLLSGFSFYYFLFRPLPAGNPPSNSNVENGQFPASTSKLPDRLIEKMVQITGGTFQMGRNDVTSRVQDYGVQFPAHTVSVDRFYMDLTEVTNREYAQFIQEAKHKAPENWQGSEPPDGQENFPVTYVSNFDAKDFAAWVSKRINTKCQLPTEEQWEYAARSGNQQNIYPWGNEWIPGRANIDSGILKEAGTTGEETSVGKIKDMMGNVTEWTDTTFRYYPEFPKEDENPDSKANIFPTVRGASFASTKDQIKNKYLLLTYRRGVSGDTKAPYLGFRLACHPLIP
jgi:formylglycine-generating enzyme required for sulfatase activity